MSCERFGPTLDTARHRKCRRLAALVRTVEFRVVEERAFVVAHDCVGGCRLGAGSFHQDLVLQAARQRTTPSFVLFSARKASPSFLFVAASSSTLGFMFRAKIGLQRDHRGLGFVVGQQRLGVSQSVFHAAQQNVGINVDVILAHAFADI